MIVAQQFPAKKDHFGPDPELGGVVGGHNPQRGRTYTKEKGVLWVPWNGIGGLEDEERIKRDDLAKLGQSRQTIPLEKD